MVFRQTMSEQERMRKWHNNEICMWQAMSTKERVGILSIFVVLALWPLSFRLLFH